MNSFEKRRNKGKELEEYLLNHLKKNKIEYILTGYEHLLASDNALKVLQKIKEDRTTDFIRYYPDTLVIVKNSQGENISCLIEIKNSSGIEYRCYNNYKILNSELGINVLFFLKNYKICLLQDLRFNQSKSFDPIAKMDIPIKDGIWKVPREMENKKYIEYLDAYSKAGKYTSGCSFAFIDFINTKFYDLSILRGA